MKNNKIIQITGLRGLAAFIIAYMLHWYILFLEIPNLGSVVIENVYISTIILFFYGSDIFFVISGCFLHRSYENKISKGEISFSNYMWPKIKKIYPIMIVTAVITWGLQILGLSVWGQYPLHADGGELRNSITSLILSILGLQGGYVSDGDSMAVNGPSWFISVLFLCYIIYYLVMKLIKNNYVKYALFLGLILLGVYVNESPVNMPLLYLINGRGYISFFAGVFMGKILQILQDSKKDEKVKKIVNRIVYLLVLFALIFTLYCFVINGNQLPHQVVVICLVVWPSIVYLAINGYLLKKILSLKIFIILGEMSLAICLCNFPTDVLIRMCDLKFGWNLDYRNAFVWLIHILVSLVIAWIFHKIFEIYLPMFTINNGKK